MSCFTPNYIVYAYGKPGRFAGRLNQTAIDAYNTNPDAQLVPIPCGRCNGCRKDYAKRWADRCLLEYHTERPYGRQKAIFITLTYDNPHLHYVTCTDCVPRQSLYKRDLQLFFKRLRKSGYRCRYLACGEYGSKTKRPHYHAIIFGLDVATFADAVRIDRDEAGNISYTSSELAQIWGNGNIQFSDANYATMCYTAQYVVKKIYHSDSLLDEYKGREIPFIVTSRKPGIGADYFDGYPFAQVALPDSDGNVIKISRPRCVMDKLKLSDPELYESIKSQQRQLSADKRDLISDTVNVPWLTWLDDQKRRSERFMDNERDLY